MGNLAYNDKHMEFVRKFALVLISPLLVILLFNLAATTSVTQVATKPAKVKSIISGAGIYDSVVPALLDEAGKVQRAGEEVSLQNSAARQAAEQTFDPQFIKQQTESFIDSMYAWLEGETPLPDFQLDLSAKKADFAANLAKAAQDKLAALPICPAGTPPSFDVDPFTATCRPVGLDPAAEAAAIEQNILSGSGFLDHPVITANTIKQEGEGRSVFADQLKGLPEIYQKVELAPYVLGVLALLLAMAIVLLSSTKAKGLRRAGIIFLMVGVIVLAISFATNRVVDEGLKQVALQNAVLDDKAKVLIKKVVQDASLTYRIFGGVYAVLGVLAIGGGMYLARRHPEPEDKDDLEGEGQTPEDRIELKEPDHPTDFESPRGDAVVTASKPPTVHKPTHKPAKPAAKKPAKKIKIQ